MKAQHKHDCEDNSCCRFLCHAEGIDYYVSNGGKGIIKRFSSYGPDYHFIEIETAYKFKDTI